MIFRMLQADQNTLFQASISHFIVIIFIVAIIFTIYFYAIFGLFPFCLISCILFLIVKGLCTWRGTLFYCLKKGILLCLKHTGRTHYRYIYSSQRPQALILSSRRSLNRNPGPLSIPLCFHAVCALFHPKSGLFFAYLILYHIHHTISQLHAILYQKEHPEPPVIIESFSVPTVRRSVPDTLSGFSQS